MRPYSRIADAYKNNHITQSKKTKHNTTLKNYLEKQKFVLYCYHVVTAACLLSTLHKAQFVQISSAECC